MSGPSGAVVAAAKRSDLDLEGLKLTLLTDPDHALAPEAAGRCDCTGNILWSGATRLASWLLRLSSASKHMPQDAGVGLHPFAGKRVLELGAGCGVAGQVAAYLGGDVTLTDIPEALPMTAVNVAANAELCSSGGGSASTAALTWGVDHAAFEAPWDVVLGADIAYIYDDMFVGLIDALEHFARINPDVQVIFSMGERDATWLFLDTLTKRGGTWRLLLREAVDDDDANGLVHIVQVCPPGAADREVVVWDFDWSMLNCNSDTYVLDELGAMDIFKALRKQGLPWTRLMDASLAAARTECGAGRGAIRAACAACPFDPDVIEVVRALPGLHRDNIIVSDANAVFIDNILQHHGLPGSIAHTFTNRASFEGEDGALRVAPFHDEPPGCSRCPDNLCKGLVLEGLLLKVNYRRVLYVGDGGGDFCPTTRLGPHDILFARQHYPSEDNEECPLLKKVAATGAGVNEPACTTPAAWGGEVRCKVITWRDPKELASAIKRELGI